MAELRKIIGQLALQQGNNQPATAERLQPVPNPVIANPQQDFHKDYKIKIELQNFSGSLDVEFVLDWLAEVARFFKVMNLKEDRKVSIVAYKLKGGTTVWWNSVQNELYRRRLEPIRNWLLMKQTIEN